MRRYETIFIVKPNLGEDDYTAIIDRSADIITNFGGTILTIDKWGLKKLAYDIKKESQGYYVYIEYASNPDAVNENERIFKIDDKILKYMTIKLQDKYIPDEQTETEVSESVSEEPQTTESEADQEDPATESEAVPEDSATETASESEAEQEKSATTTASEEE